VQYNDKRDFLSFPIPSVGTYVYIKNFLQHSKYVSNSLIATGKEEGYFKVDKIVGKFIQLAQYPSNSKIIRHINITDFRLGIYRFNEISKTDIPADYWKKRALCKN